MNQVRTLVQSLPLWQLAVAAAVLAAILAAIAWKAVGRVLFIARLRRAAREPDQAAGVLVGRYSPRALLRRSGLIERAARSEGGHLIGAIGMDELWLRTLTEHRRKSDLLRVLRWVAPKGLFQCFVVVMDRRRLAPILLDWLRGAEGSLDVHKLALAGKGEDFDGAMARETFREHLDPIREMTGDPEWPSRYFAVKILLHDPDERSIRALWDAFADSHPLVRRTVAENLVTEERGRLYDELIRVLLKDPVYEVRRIAWQRIHVQLPDLYRLNPQELTEVEAYHVLELLRPDSKDDENLGLSFLAGDNLELRFSAARFLQRCGALDRLAQEVDLGDREGLERNAALLKNASEVGVTGFLAIIERTSRPATLLLCARILAETGSRPLLANLTRKVFGTYRGEPDQQELYRTTVAAVAARGPYAALTDLNRELLRRKSDIAEATIILDAIPSRADYIFADTLIGFLKDPGFELVAELRRAIERTIPGIILPLIFEILQSDRVSHPHKVRIRALQVLGDLELPYCMQAILENLPILPEEDAVEFATTLARLPRDRFIERVEALLKVNDARVRAATIATIPATGEKEFLRSVRPALKDADPDVRVAAVRALVRMSDTRSLGQATDMLRDPVQRVRAAVAEALGAHGGEEAVKRLRDVLLDPNEVTSVKLAAARGLAASELEGAVDALVAALPAEEDLRPAILDALAAHTARRPLERMVESFRDAPQDTRVLLTEAFKRMRERGEQAMAALLAEDVPSLRSQIVEILETTGYVEARIRGLAHRDPEVRREAAEFLSMVGSRSAFRGIMLAARDPDEQVRIRVIKALERLGTEAGGEILAALENDPDKKVRTYTAWAMERLRAKAL